MNVKEIVESIPQVLLFIVPGFLALKLIEMMTPRKRLEQNETILWSVLYSFIVMIIYSLSQQGVSWLSSLCCCPKLSEATTSIPNSQEQGNNLDYSKIAWHLVISVIFAFAHIKLFSSSIGVKISKMFNNNIVPGEDLWFKALKSKKGVYARVYLENGLVYYGILSDFTSNSDDDTKLIVLKKYTVFLGPLRDKPETLTSVVIKKLSEGSYNPKEEFFTVIRDYKDNKDIEARVLLRYDDIVSIELL